PHVLLSTCSRTDATVLEDGSNVDVIWKPDYSAFVVITDKGFLHFYDISIESNSPTVKYQWANSHHYTPGVGESNGPAKAIINFRMALEIDSGSVTLNQVISIVCVDESMDIYVWICDDGKVYVAQRSIGDESELDADSDLGAVHWAGLCIYNSGADTAAATYVAVNSRFLLIAIGNAKGEVSIYSMSEDRQEVFFMRSISRTKIEHSPQKTGPVSCMSWSNDGYTIAIAWQDGGLSVWSVFGKILLNSDVDEWSNSSFNWCQDDQIFRVNDLIPTLYIATSWPIKYAAMNHEGSHIVIAGKYGFACCHITSQRWKLFGVESEEISFSVRGGCCWFGSTIVAAIEDIETSTFHRDGKWDRTVLSENVEYYWLMDKDEDFRAMWAFCGHGMRVWISPNPDHARPIVAEFATDFYPLSIMFARGIVFGLQSIISSLPSLNCVMFKPKAYSQLFLDEILRGLLDQNLTVPAAIFIRKYLQFNYFTHALEMLLHKVLDDDYSNRVDSNRWKEITNINQESLKAKRLRTATSYLIIIQSLDPVSVSVKFAIELLQKALDLNDFTIAKELLRFYKSIDGFILTVFGNVIPTK
ncbi:hypothetical protein HDU82_007497, partial [Entophlyctis luteolus]